ncbi:peptidase M29 aminopeptidase II [Deinococcus proteolyticus MRP]|uniref:Peptidase M29 aminopeptidase II n=2 Tax=Deinococcaceae TaxID=183710 RepID=F0RMC0_DEIPM|nr:peptidase M29 aminopeptidase II [Deinococcus proteolyticus MRP]
MLRAMSKTFEEKLREYARVLVGTGVGLKAGGKLLINAPIDAVPLVREMVAEAYRTGALDVRVDWRDDQLERLRYTEGSREAALFIPEWVMEQAERMVDDGYARIGIRGDDPNLLAGVDGQLIAERTKRGAELSRKVSAAISGHTVDWTLGAMSTPAWARSVYPDLPEAEGVARLWEDIFTVSRINEADPAAAWQAHTDRLARLSAYLNEQQFDAVHFRSAEGTDLTVGLADGHIWDGGAMTGPTGTRTVPNMPTDEVFTAPHRDRVDGVAVASKPLSVHGTLVSGIRMRFEGGRAVEATAETGQDTLQQLLATDEGAARLGEVALVPASAPVAQTGSLFNMTLFDENAASHIAMGRCYSTNVQGGSDEQALTAAGGNRSLIHVDWMIGSPTTDVDGLTRDGNRIPLMRQGEWVVDAAN